MRRSLVFGDDWIEADLPDDVLVMPPGVSAGVEAAADLSATVDRALKEPLDRPPLREQVRSGMKVTVAFDDPTVPCYAPVWETAIPAILMELEKGGVATDDISLLCANALHRKFTLDELARTIGDDVVEQHRDRITCHDAEDPDRLVHLGTTPSGLDVELNSAVVESDLTVYLNCSTMRGFSGGWKSVCVGLSSYRSIHHHHTPDIMSMSLDRNRMHAMLDEMGALVERQLDAERVFKLETVLANPLEVHAIYSGSVGATRKKVIDTLRAHQGSRRDMLDEPVDVVVYGVPDWSPYAAFSHTNPILDLISTGLGYLGGVIQAFGRPGCTVILASPCRDRWDRQHHASYPEVWSEVLPVTKDPDEARMRFEPELAARDDYIDKYRFDNAFHPVHAVMALYPLKRLRHAARVIVAGAEDESVPAHCGFDAAPTIETALDMAHAEGDASRVALVEYPPAFNRQ
ncbi:MAG: lactate racemase domain-containing protein [Actinomycetota bacterium]|nr:lactate racemase domain-containing protein [Actinomycetota bacterium]